MTTRPHTFSPMFIRHVAVAAFGCSAIAGLATADPGMPLTKAVAYSDLNLSSAAGTKALYARLRSAAQEVCRPLLARAPDRLARWHTCYGEAIGTAIAKVNRPELTALHNEQARPPKG